jgi:hypothetical protein
MLPVGAKVPVAGLYSSAVATEQQPPAINTIPLFSSVAVWRKRAVFMLWVKTNLVTVKVVEPSIAPKAAPIVVCPSATALASPAAFIVATPGADELHVAVFVRSCVLPSLYVPVAVNCCAWLGKIEGFAGVTAIERSSKGTPVPVRGTMPGLPKAM